MSTSKVQGMVKTENHHLGKLSQRLFRQESSLDAKVGGWRFYARDIGIIFGIFHHIKPMTRVKWDFEAENLRHFRQNLNEVGISDFTKPQL